MISWPNFDIGRQFLILTSVPVSLNTEPLTTAKAAWMLGKQVIEYFFIITNLPAKAARPSLKIAPDPGPWQANLRGSSGRFCAPNRSVADTQLWPVPEVPGQHC